ncbi:MAG TPA: hypothetical protein VM889_00155 [Candidatus Thermoplasmatota archaeon]|nr:hypothetical protein [Candidatus Thermoplasmatota archaeon]
MGSVHTAVRLVLVAALVAPVLAAALVEGQVEDVASERTRKTTHVKFYGHVFGAGLDTPMPANAQPTDGESNYGLGFFGKCVQGVYYQGLAPDVQEGYPKTNVDCDRGDTLNKLALFSSAGFVDVKSRNLFLSQGDYTLFHNERGNTKDIVLDTTQDVTASVYLSLDAHSWLVGSVAGGSNETNCPYYNPPDTGCLYPYWGWDPAAWPNYEVRATLYAAVLGDHGSDPSVAPPIREAIESGKARVLAEGKKRIDNVMNGLPNAPNVLKFEVNLGPPQSPVVEREESFFLVYSWYTVGPDGKPFNHDNWRLWAGEYYPPTFTLPVKNAFDVELVVPRFLHGKLAILGLISTPWGSYDVDPRETKLVVESDRGEIIVPERVLVYSDFFTGHGAHYKPVNVTYIWDYVSDGLKPGLYRATVSAKNYQHSASAACSATFTIAKDGSAGDVTVGRCGLSTEAFLATGPATSAGGGEAGPENGRGRAAPPPRGLLPVDAAKGVL